MPFELTANSGGATLTLNGRLGVQQARPLWDELSVAVSRGVVSGKKVRLDASGVEEIDTSIAQILFRCAAQLEIGSASDGFMASLRLRGLEHCFAEREREPASGRATATKRVAKASRKAA